MDRNPSASRLLPAFPSTCPPTSTPTTVHHHSPTKRTLQVAEGRVKAEVQQVLPLDRAGEAMGLVEGRHVRGKVVIRMR